MNSIPSISLSGLNAAQTQLRVAAHNIANLNTADFHRQEVTQSTQSGGGVRAEIGRAGSAGHNLEADIVQQLEARNSFQANLFVFKTGNAVLGSLLDISA